jgi:hypothetical protein
VSPLAPCRAEVTWALTASLLPPLSPVRYGRWGRLLCTNCVGPLASNFLHPQHHIGVSQPANPTSPRAPPHCTPILGLAMLPTRAGFPALGRFLAWVAPIVGRLTCTGCVCARALCTVGPSRAGRVEGIGSSFSK